MMILVGVISIRRGYTNKVDEKLAQVSLKSAFAGAILPLLLPVVIIGGIRLGIFTPTEAGAVAIVYAVLLSVMYREFSLKNVAQALKDTVLTTSSIMLIVGAASAFAWVLTREQIPQMLTQTIVETIHNKYLFLIVVNIFLLFVGMFIEGNATMIVLVPLLAPVARAYGIDDIQFAMMFIFNLAIGALSPPMGTLMFVTCGITGCKIAKFIKEAVPFYVLLMTCLMLLTFVPFFSLVLVNLFY
jgi:tripartite ATP-independent transporter DctM subunit